MALLASEEPKRWGREDFDRPTVEVARSLLGTQVIRRTPDGRMLRAVISETEAYVAGDLANHACYGPTRKNWTMFSGPGHLYVYHIHRYFCANVTTVPGEAVLLRVAVADPPWNARLGGPGLLCQGLEISREQDGIDLTTSREVHIAHRKIAPDPIVVRKRVGIRYAQDAPLRFVASVEDA